MCDVTAQQLLIPGPLQPLIYYIFNRSNQMANLLTIRAKVLLTFFKEQRRTSQY